MFSGGIEEISGMKWVNKLCDFRSIAKCKLSQLFALRVKKDSSTYFYICFIGAYVVCKNGDRQIPLLRTLFEKFSSVPMNIDIKTYNEELIDKVSDIIFLHTLNCFVVWFLFCYV